MFSFKILVGQEPWLRSQFGAEPISKAPANLAESATLPAHGALHGMALPVAVTQQLCNPAQDRTEGFCSL
jgi:hypothetical protein